MKDISTMQLKIPSTVLVIVIVVVAVVIFGFITPLLVGLLCIRQSEEHFISLGNFNLQCLGDLYDIPQPLFHPRIAF